MSAPRAPVLLLVALFGLPATAAEQMATGGGRAPLAASASVMFKIIIPPVLNLKVTSEPTVSVTAEDLNRGYLDAAAPQEVLVTSNLAKSYALRLDIVIPQFKRVTVSTQPNGQGGRSFGAEGLSLPQPQTNPATRQDDFEFRYRFELAPGLQPGNYPWPVAVALVQP